MSVDQIWAGCVVPDDRLYDTDLHVWVSFDGAEAVLGMTDVAQSMGGRVVALTWKEPGRNLRRGQSIAVVESAKWVGPFPSPLTGRLVATNKQAFDDDIAIANRDPYGAGWMARIAPTAVESERQFLTDGASAFAFYRNFIDANEIRCFRCEE